MKKVTFLALLIVTSLILTTSPILATRSQPFLGIGLDRIPPQKNSDGIITEYGKTLYEIQDMNELGPVWVYNWTLPKPNQYYSNDPYQDFGNKFIPMVFGCGEKANINVMNWIKRNNYEGYVLFLNEPDNSSAGGGSACLPQTAVTKLDNFISHDTPRAPLRFARGI